MMTLSGEMAQRDRMDGHAIAATGGSAWLAQAGIDLYVSHVQLHTAVQAPVHQRWNDDAPNN